MLVLCHLHFLEFFIELQSREQPGAALSSMFVHSSMPNLALMEGQNHYRTGTSLHKPFLATGAAQCSFLP